VTVTSRGATTGCLGECRLDIASEFSAEAPTEAVRALGHGSSCTAVHGVFRYVHSGSEWPLPSASTVASACQGRTRRRLLTLRLVEAGLVGVVCDSCRVVTRRGVRGGHDLPVMARVAPIRTFKAVGGHDGTDVPARWMRSDENRGRSRGGCPLPSVLAPTALRAADRPQIAPLRGR
jgi:hypothetical protein